MCGFCEWEEYLDTIEEMRSDKRFFWCDDTLYGIHQQVVKKQHITPNQARAIDNYAKKVWG